MSESQTINFELVSPEEKLVSEAVRMAVIPGEEGEFGVGADHASLVASLKAGVVKLYKTSLQDEPRRIFIAGGFADVTGTRCTVLAEEAIDISKLNATEIEQQIIALQSDLNAITDAADRMRAERKLALAKARLMAATGKLAA